MLGHMLGAAGAVEAAIAVLALQQGIVPPTINLENPRLRGINAALVFKKYLRIDRGDFTISKSRNCFYFSFKIIIINLYYN